MKPDISTLSINEPKTDPQQKNFFLDIGKCVPFEKEYSSEKKTSCSSNEILSKLTNLNIPSLLLEEYALQAISIKELSKKNTTIEILELLKDICIGLEKLQNNNISHSNLNPSTVLYVENQYKIGYFTYAREIKDQTSMEVTKDIQINIGYQAPELASAKYVNPYKSDVYSLGLICLEMMNCKIKKETIFKDEISFEKILEKEFRNEKQVKKIMKIFNGMLHEIPDEKRFDFKILMKKLNSFDKKFNLSKLKNEIQTKSFQESKKTKINDNPEKTKIIPRVSKKIKKKEGFCPQWKNKKLLKMTNSVETLHVDKKEHVHKKNEISISPDNLKKISQFEENLRSEEHFYVIEDQTKKTQILQISKKIKKKQNIKKINNSTDKFHIDDKISESQNNLKKISIYEKNIYPDELYKDEQGKVKVLESFSNFDKINDIIEDGEADCLSLTNLKNLKNLEKSKEKSILEENLQFHKNNKILKGSENFIKISKYEENPHTYASFSNSENEKDKVEEESFNKIKDKNYQHIQNKKKMCFSLQKDVEKEDENEKQNEKKMNEEEIMENPQKPEIGISMPVILPSKPYEILESDRINSSKNFSEIQTPKNMLISRKCDFRRTNKKINRNTSKNINKVSRLSTISYPSISSDNIQLEEFSKFKDEFKFNKIIGSGGFSNVMSAYYKNVKKNVVLKFIDIARKKLIINECKLNKTIADFNDPHFLEYYGAYKDTELKKVILIIEKGKCSLKDLERNYTFSETMYLLKKLIKPLVKLQRNNIFHGDIKPENIILKKNKRKILYMLSDFGASKELSPDKTEINVNEDVFYSTNYYAAPEIVLKYQIYNPFKSDVYSLGITMLVLMGWKKDENKMEFLKKKNCFENDKAINILRKMLEEDFKQRCDFLELESILNSSFNKIEFTIPKDEIKYFYKLVDKKKNELSKQKKLFFKKDQINDQQDSYKDYFDIFKLCLHFSLLKEAHFYKKLIFPFVKCCWFHKDLKWEFIENLVLFYERGENYRNDEQLLKTLLKCDDDGQYEFLNYSDQFDNKREELKYKISEILSKINMHPKLLDKSREIPQNTAIYNYKNPDYS